MKQVKLDGQVILNKSYFNLCENYSQYIFVLVLCEYIECCERAENLTKWWNQSQKIQRVL